MLGPRLASARKRAAALPRRRWLSTTSITSTLRREAAVDIHPEVRDALAAQRPVVALETALVTHGLPSPTNLEVAQKLEGIVRAHGAIPATIGIVEGRVKVGLKDEELQRLADTVHTKAVKVRFFFNCRVCYL